MNTDRTPSAQCLFCGGDMSAPDHLAHCDGRQGRVEAAEHEIVLQARHGDPETSHAAMASLDEERMRNVAAVAEWLHRTRGPLADFEFRAAFTEVVPYGDQSLYRRARCIARDAGRIRDSGMRKENPTTGRKQILWEACDLAPVHVDKCPTCGHVLSRRKPRT